MSHGSTSFHLNAQESVSWPHILSKNGGIEVPDGRTEQTSAAVTDYDNDSKKDS
jgi:hypothetical protein